MNKLKVAILTFAVLIGAAALVPSYSAGAAAKDQIIIGANETGTADGTTLQGRIKTITNVMLYIIGALSVVMIIFGGIKYVVSAGDSSKVTSAKNTIMYAVIGLVVAILAYAIVNFVITQF